MELRKKMLVTNGAVVLAMLASYFGSSSGWPFWVTLVCLILAIVLVLVTVYLEWRASASIREFPLGRTDQRGERGIRDYMRKLISRGSTVAIFTRDMSWTDKELDELLESKAKQGSLTLVMPKATQLSTRLQKRGATVCYYGTVYTGVINTRFTMINMDRNSTVLAVGRATDDIHRIERFSDPTDPALLMAEDMFRLIRELT